MKPPCHEGFYRVCCEKKTPRHQDAPEGTFPCRVDFCKEEFARIHGDSMIGAPGEDSGGENRMADCFVVFDYGDFGRRRPVYGKILLSAFAV
jgi:hypothetical protein